MDNLSLYLATYNVGTNDSFDQSLPLLDLLSLSEEKNEKLPDFFVIGLQEVKSKPMNRLLDALFDDYWTYALRNILDERGYVKLKSIRLQGLVLSVFTLRKHLLNVREIDAEYTRTGKWGIKGAVCIRLNIYGCSICFVNSHLAAHDFNLKDREADYNNIIKDLEFHVEETSKIFCHDYVFWLGDLNFRLTSDYEKTSEEIERSILANDLRTLLERDELRYCINKGRSFSEFTEQEPDFAPTFKFKVGTSDYDHKRRPAWCDRILHRVNSNKYENVTLKVDQLSYKSHPSYMISDHKPVSAEFIIKITPSMWCNLTKFLVGKEAKNTTKPIIKLLKKYLPIKKIGLDCSG
ncbi:unnamed protein product [Ceutorhynchus assimilis]|uniref:Inositol polyphosphate-related phosphatase domain-containing protein n=1 Tax=Ceutorhynchus assimilis TaxID=467358 RepID=A0A9P0GMW8_9CUCU|nr:unnamed protein product [Ceutorhynchus assimilis]